MTRGPATTAGGGSGRGKLGKVAADFFFAFDD
jgi:hypothetical protein